MAKALATRVVSKAKILGKEILLFLNYGENATEESPVWTLVGGQRSADFSSSADEIDLSDKVSGGYGDSAQGIKSTELSMEILVKKGDETVQALYEAHNAGEPVHILRYVPGGASSINWYNINEISESAAHDDAATLSLTLKGCGAPVFKQDMADPREIA